MFHDGWYYLLATHGSCCRGSDSGYNIRVGRATAVTGPFLDNMGVDMIEGGGKLFVGSNGRDIGPGHFGLLDLGDGVQKFSCHYEADLDRGGASVLDLRPVLWKDGWPEAGENMKGGTYEIQSVRTGTSLELAVEGVPVGGRRPLRGGGGGFGGRRGGPGAGVAAGETNAAGGQIAVGEPGGTNAAGGRGVRRGGGGGMFAGQGGVIPPQDVAQVSTNFKITIAGTDRALAVSEDAELVALPAFSGGPEQLWRIEQLTDGTWRIMPKSVPNSKDALALSAIGSSFATLGKFDPTSDMQRWLIRAP
jgi:arabinan endo-1,5-alpha-L-arabinosidase